LADDFHDTRNSRARSPDLPERRIHPRHQVALTVEIQDQKTGMHLSVRTTDISAGGCFVDLLSPLPVGTPVRMRFHGKKKAFEIPGVVVYSQDSLGMGISFSKMGGPEQGNLDHYLESLARPDFPKRKNPADESAQEEEDHLVTRLIYLLMERGLITEEDVTAILGRRTT
jgi:PilZ domain